MLAPLAFRAPRGLTLLFGAGAVASAALGQDLAAVPVVDGLAQPTIVTAPPLDFDRLFVGEQGGVIRILERGTLLPAPFLDVSHAISTGGEQGLLGLAFHPDYSINGRFFISVTDRQGDTALLEFTASPADPNVASPLVVRTIYTQPQPYENHNGGCIHFSRDGYLLLALGDGGGSFDPLGNAQDLSNGHGSLLRFDVDAAAPFIPQDNPFVGAGGEEAIFAYGFRNPWRFSVDRSTGDVWLGDVGQHEREEVNVLPFGSPGAQNFGWRCMEGTTCTGYSGCDCLDAALVPPVHEVTHGTGDCSITGGYVYRGRGIPELFGRYVFGDFCSSRIRSLSFDGTDTSDERDHTLELEPQGPATIITISSFGEDAAGELYICDYSGGAVYRIEQECSAVPYCTSLPNSTGFGGRIGSLGTTSLTARDFGLQAWSVPPGALGLFFYGPSPAEIPLADGVLCVSAQGGRIARMAPVTIGSNQRVEMMLDFTSAPVGAGPSTLQPFSSTYFQFWHRDAQGPLGTGSNFTRGLRVTFCP